jgi:hypothetical protein
MGNMTLRSLEPRPAPRRGRWLRRTALSAAVACLAAYLAVVGLLFSLQRALVFPADPRPVSAAESGLTNTRDVVIEADDGQRLVGFYRPAEPGHATVLYFFGQAGSLANRATRLRLLSADGTGVLLVAYRGYSGSGGTPSEGALHADADRVWRWLREQGVAPAQIALAWVYAQQERLGVPLAPIPGTKRVKWLEQNIAALDITLTEDELALLDPLGSQVSGARY